MKKLKSLLVSNVLDPLTHTDEDLIKMYKEVSKLGFYNGIETRLIEDDSTIQMFNEIAISSKWNVTYWITGVMSRKKLSLSSLDEELRVKSVNEAKRLIDLANKHIGHNIGIASGPVEDYEKIDSQIDSFQKSIQELIEYLLETKSKYSIINEPLDYNSHKNNVIGNLENTMKLMNKIMEDKNINSTKFTLCWDSAHVALNSENFETSISTLAPYITRIHFADAIIDPNSDEYGDNHRHFDQKGIMNIETANEIIELVNRHSKNKSIYFAVEARTKNDENPWEMESKYRSFLEEVLKEKIL